MIQTNQNMLKVPCQVNYQLPEIIPTSKETGKHYQATGEIAYMPGVVTLDYISLDNWLVELSKRSLEPETLAQEIYDELVRVIDSPFRLTLIVYSREHSKLQMTMTHEVTKVAQQSMPPASVPKVVTANSIAAAMIGKKPRR